MPIARREKSKSYVPLGILAEVTVPEKEYARAVATPESQPHAPGPECPLRNRISRSAEQIDKDKLMELAAIQLNMRVFSDQHLDDPVADVVPAVAVMVPMVAKHDHDALRLRSRWVEELMDGWIRAGRLLIGLVQNETQEKGLRPTPGDGDRSLKVSNVCSVLY